MNRDQAHSVAAALAVPDDTAHLCEPGYGSTAGQITGLSAIQLDNTCIITRIGVNMGMSTPGEAITLATALQEYGLRNLNFGDRDSPGLFQQHPSQGWGTPAQILDPAYASRQFYTHLLRVPDWRSMPTTQAAQAVQRSGFPDAHAK